MYNNNLDEIETYHLYYMEEAMDQEGQEIELDEEETKYTSEVDDE